LQKNERIWQKHLFLSFIFCNFVSGIVYLKKMEKEIFIDLLNKSMRETEQRMLSMGRIPQSTTRKDALKQVAMQQRAKVACKQGCIDKISNHQY